MGASLPVQGAALYTPCLGTLYDAQIPGSVTTAASCATGTGVGSVSAPPPDNEYLNLLTGIVYQQTSSGLAPVGVGAAGQGYVELTTVSLKYGYQSSPPDCSSTMPFGCADEPVSNGIQVKGSPTSCPVQACEHVHVAVTGCSTVTISFLLSIPGDVPPPSVSYPCGSSTITPPNPPPLPEPIIHLPLQTSVLSTEAATLVDATFTLTPGCWYAAYANNPLDPMFHGDPNNPPSQYQVPEDLTSTITVDGVDLGHTRVEIC